MKKSVKKRFPINIDGHTNPFDSQYIFFNEPGEAKLSIKIAVMHKLYFLLLNLSGIIIFAHVRE
jgi:hypothetical protein